jgi:hypothetical protein
MDARTAGLIERNVERCASAAFGGAVGFAAYAFASGPLPSSAALAAGGLALLVAAVASSRFLRSIPVQESQYDVPGFELTELNVEPEQPLAAVDEPLELVDALPEPAADARVIRLFAPEAMPAQIERILHDEHGRAIPDAAQDLYKALAELRRSLR